MKHELRGLIPTGISRQRSTAFVVALTAVAAIAAGCGSDNNDSGSSGSAATSTAAASTPTTTAAASSGGDLAAKVDAAYQKALKPPTTIGDFQPIKGTAPTGKKVVYIYCGAPVCNVLADGAKKAAAVLGWSYQTLSTDGTPESVKKAWATAARMKADVVLSSGYNTAVYKNELAQLKKQGAFVANYATTDPGLEGGVDIRIGGPDGVGVEGDQLATWIAKDSASKANTLYVSVPSFVILGPVQDHFKSTYKELCPDCKLDSIDLPITALGKDSPARIVSYLRAHPDVNYVALSLDAAGVGLPAALKAAGLSDKVKFLGSSGAIENINYIKTGLEGATVDQGYYEEQAVLIDAAVRYFLKEDYTLNKNFPIPYWLDVKDSNPSADGFKPQVPDLYGVMAKLWKK